MCESIATAISRLWRGIRLFWKARCHLLLLDLIASRNDIAARITVGLYIWYIRFRPLWLLYGSFGDADSIEKSEEPPWVRWDVEGVVGWGRGVNGTEKGGPSGSKRDLKISMQIRRIIILYVRLQPSGSNSTIANAKYPWFRVLSLWSHICPSTVSLYVFAFITKLVYVWVCFVSH